MASVRRDQTARIIDIRTAGTRCTVYSESNQYLGKDVDPANAWRTWETNPAAKLDERDGYWTISVHDNHWYELFPNAAPNPAADAPSTHLCDDECEDPTHPQDGRVHPADPPAGIPAPALELATDAGVDPDLLKQVLSAQVGRDAAEKIVTQLDTATAQLDPELDCRCAQRDEPQIPQVSTCKACGRSWCDRCHPTPSARCPFEYDHPEPEDDGPVPSGRLTWEAGGCQGEIVLSDEQTATLLLDGQTLLGLDLATGTMLVADGQTAHTVATFGPALPVRAPNLRLATRNAEVIDVPQRDLPEGPSRP